MGVTAKPVAGGTLYRSTSSEWHCEVCHVAPAVCASSLRGHLVATAAGPNQSVSRANAKKPKDAEREGLGSCQTHGRLAGLDGKLPFVQRERALCLQFLECADQIGESQDERFVLCAAVKLDFH